MGPKPVAYLGQRRFAPTYTPRAFCQRVVGRKALTEKMPVETRGPVCCRLRRPSWLATPLILPTTCRFASAGRHNRPGIRAQGLLRASCPWPSRAHPHPKSSGAATAPWGSRRSLAMTYARELPPGKRVTTLVTCQLLARLWPKRTGRVSPLGAGTSDLNFPGNCYRTRTAKHRYGSRARPSPFVATCLFHPSFRLMVWQWVS